MCEGAAGGQGVPQGVRATRGEEGKESPPGDGRAVPSVSGTGPPAGLTGQVWLVGGHEGPSARPGKPCFPSEAMGVTKATVCSVGIDLELNS